MTATAGDRAESIRKLIVLMLSYVYGVVGYCLVIMHIHVSHAMYSPPFVQPVG
jgi:hypothetical protein